MNRRRAMFAVLGVVCALGAGAWLYFAPLVHVNLNPGTGPPIFTRRSAYAVTDTFTLVYGAVGVALASIGGVGLRLGSRSSSRARWVSAVGLSVVSFLAFIATFGDPRFSLVFAPAAVLMFLSVHADRNLNQVTRANQQ